MKDKPLNLHVKLGNHEFDAPFADRGALMSNDSTLLFEQLPEDVAKSLYEEIKESRNTAYPLSVQGKKFSLEADIRISVLGYHALEDRYYLVFVPGSESDS